MKNKYAQIKRLAEKYSLEKEKLSLNNLIEKIKNF